MYGRSRSGNSQQPNWYLFYALICEIINMWNVLWVGHCVGEIAVVWFKFCRPFWLISFFLLRIIIFFWSTFVVVVGALTRYRISISFSIVVRKDASGEKSREWCVNGICNINSNLIMIMRVMMKLSKYQLLDNNMQLFRCFK